MRPLLLLLAACSVFAADTTKLRIAHAGAYDESGGGRVIFSLNLQPTQLRIGLVISRGSGAENSESMPRGGLPEVARVDGSMIVVEPYQSRTVWSRRRE